MAFDDSLFFGLHAWGVNLFTLLAVLVLAYAAVAIPTRGLVKRGLLARNGLETVNWLFLLLLGRLLDEALAPLHTSELLRKAFLLAYILIGWKFAKSIIDGFYKEIYLTKIKQRQVNQLWLDLLKFLLLLGLVMIGLKSVLNIQPGSILTSSAILTAVIGFSLQDTIGSLFSGLLIQMEKPFKPGNWIRVGDAEGQVVEITWRYTKLRTVERNYILVPNNIISRTQLINYNEPVPFVRQNVRVPAPLDAPPVKIKYALEDAMNKCRLVLPKPTPRARFREITENRIIYEMQYYIKDYADAAPSRDEVQSSVWYEFKKMGMDLPQPMLRVEQLAPAAHGGALHDAVKLLQGISLFAGMSEDDLGLLIVTSSIRTYAHGFQIVRQGQKGTTLYIILEGTVAVKRGGNTLAELGAGQFFGEMALLTGEARAADVFVTADAAKCLIVDREGFRIIMDKSPVVIRNIEEIFRARAAQTARDLASDAPEGGAQSLWDRFKSIFSWA